MKNDLHQTHVLVIGSGISGLTAALRLAEAGVDVTVLSKEEDPREGNTLYAQGGIVTLGPTDSQKLLTQDVLSAGDGVSYPPAVKKLVAEGTEIVKTLLLEKVKVPFTTDERGELLYAQEGNHSRRRILFSKDQTGRAIEEALYKKVSENPHVHFLKGAVAVDLITTNHHSTNPLRAYEKPQVLGAYALLRAQGKVIPLFSRATVLATGGLGRAFLHTTNPSCTRGDGYAMAYRAGAQILNMEYTKFHPTAFYSSHMEDHFLISEAVRGEGAVLKTQRGRAFMEDYSPLKDLAPRDVVSRAIYEEMLKNDDAYVLLDLSNLSVDPRERFPYIYKTCLENGVDITRSPIPVVPALHYRCGGVLVDLNGRTTLGRLYAVGEVACTGVHGANRLASTSLLEGLAWGWFAAGDILAKDRLDDDLPFHEIPLWKEPAILEATDPALIVQDGKLIRSTLWNYAGILRTTKRLQRAKADIEYLKHRIDHFYKSTPLEDSVLGLRNIVDTALLVINSALRNRVSRGSHTILTDQN